MAQFEISRDGGGNEVEAAKRVWRARFSLDVEPAGPVHALVSLRRRQDVGADVGGAAGDRGAIARRRGATEPGAQQGRTQPGDIVIRDGAPPQPAPARAGHFLDRAL